MTIADKILEIERNLFNKKMVDQLSTLNILCIPAELLNNPEIQQNINSRLIELFASVQKHSAVMVVLLDALKNLSSDKFSVKLKNVHLLQMIAELALLILRPEFIHQLVPHLDDAANFLKQWAEHEPEVLVALSLQLMMHEKIQEPFTLHLSKDVYEEATSITEILWLELKKTNFKEYSFKVTDENLPSSDYTDTHCDDKHRRLARAV